jgi:uncharacterized protein with ParB-like and HNH nuclease domain
MKANPTYLLEALSNNDVTFFIPPYQRNYEWKLDTCKVFLDDVIKVALENQAGKKTEHFFGSIVYVVEESGFGQPARYILTDGQQRITTTMLFLMALRDSLEEKTYVNAIQLRYIENQRVSEDSDLKIKLKQVETDWEAYKHLALRKHESFPSELKNSAVYQNYTFFKRELDKRSQEVKKGLLERGLDKFSVISIELEPDKNPWENPQEIFESMNSLGQPLGLADLVRNFLLMGKSSKEQTKLYNDFWLKLEKQLPGKLSEFIRDWMQANQHRSYKVAKDSNHKELYSQFKEITQDRSYKDLFEEFVQFLEPYSIVSGVKSDESKSISSLLADLHAIGISPAYSYLTEVMMLRADGDLSESQVTEILTCIRTYLLRRRVLRLTQAENKAFPAFGLHVKQLIDSDDITKDFYRQLSSNEYALRLPNDDEVRSRLKTMNFYNFGTGRTYPLLMLSLIEEALTKARPNLDDEKLQLEHILPQTLTSEWRSMLGDNFEEDHNSFVHNIGNIALIRHNQELGNKSFREKKELYADKAGLQVTQNNVLSYELWNAESIIQRQTYLIDLLLQSAISIPQEFRFNNNWGGISDSGSDPQFDSRKVLNQLIGFTIQYIPNTVLEAQVINDTEVMFEGKEWKLGALTNELKRRSGSVSSSSNFHGPSNWEFDGTRLTHIEI